MKAAVLAVGSELLGIRSLDTNSLRLAEVFERHGIDLVVKSVIGDEETAIAQEMRRHLEQVDLLVCTGGLGPTADDRTRAAAALALERTIAIDEDVVQHIRQLFRSFGRDMPEVNRRQAEVIDGAEILLNRQGSAPGQRLDFQRKDGSVAHLFLFPGVPREVEGMVRDHLEPWISSRGGGGEERQVERRLLKVAMLPESEVEERIASVYARFGRDAIAVLASPGEIRVEVSVRGKQEERSQVLAEMVAALEEALGRSIFARRREQDLESVVGEVLAEAGLTLVTAESCTGGLVAQRLTRIAGSSAWFLGGVVTYSNELKISLLGVPPAMIDTHGAVSEPVARAMAEGARSRLGGDFAVSITGVAGPGGGTPEKPVGRVHMALAGPTDGKVEHRLLQLPGDRHQIQRLTSQAALEWVRRRALAHGSGSQA